MLQDDLDNVFFNQEEFAENHNYNGSNIPIIVDDDKLIEMKLKSKEDNTDGIYSCSKLIYVKVSDVEDEPFVDQFVTLDGENYCVRSVSTEGEAYQIILGDNES